MSDLIKREDAIKAVENVSENYTKEGDREWHPHIDFITQALVQVPSVSPKQGEWIPCSEKLPTNDDWVIVSVLDEIGDTSYRYSDFGWYLEAAKCWIVESEQRTDVVAWMPLPKPYGEREGK